MEWSDWKRLIHTMMVQTWVQSSRWWNSAVFKFLNAFRLKVMYTKLAFFEPASSHQTNRRRWYMHVGYVILIGSLHDYVYMADHAVNSFSQGLGIRHGKRRQCRAALHRFWVKTHAAHLTFNWDEAKVWLWRSRLTNTGQSIHEF